MGKQTKVADVFIPSRVLDELVKGCHESVVPAVRKAIEEDSELFEGENASLIATFQGYAFAATESGKFYRVRYHVKEDVASLYDAATVKIPKISRKDAPKHIRGEARKVVQEMLSGKDSRNHLHEIAAAIFSGVSVTHEGAGGYIIERLGGERRWKIYIEDPSPMVSEFVEFDTKKFAAESKPKFKSILSGDYDPSKVEEYRKIAVGSLKEIQERVSDIARLSGMTEVSSFTLKADWRREDSGMMVGEFREFLIDFADDARGLSEDLESYLSVADTAPLEALASLHDTVAVAMERVELAGKFVKTFATRFEAV